MSKRITFIHLYNDYSGSPLVLSTVIRGLRDRGYACRLMTSKGTEGFLSNIERVEEALFAYRFYENKFIRLFVFFWTQLLMFFQVWRARKQMEVLYINTLLPFGAALAGRLAGLEVIYHIHETSVKPMILKRWLRWVAERCASKSIYVSKYLCDQERLKDVPAYTVYNALSENFLNKTKLYVNDAPPRSGTMEVLMLCSLKAYKGVNEYLTLAQRLPAIHFNLVLNATQSAIDQYFRDSSVPANLRIYPSQSNVHPFYQTAHLVLNLSHPEQWVETFGMTLLEGMAYGIPCIVPQVGGPAEIVKHGINGYKLDQRDLDSIVSHIAKLSLDKQLYEKMSRNAFLRSTDFSFKSMIAAVLSILENNKHLTATSQYQSVIH